MERRNKESINKMKVIESILAVWGLVSLVWVIVVFLNKTIFRNQIKIEGVIETIRDLRPNEKNSGEKIKLLDLPEGINQYNLAKYQNRFAITDIEKFISILENVKNKKIANEYSTPNILRLLYLIKNYMIQNEEVQVKLNSLVLSLVAMDKRYDKSRFRKMLDFVSI